MGACRWRSVRAFSLLPPLSMRHGRMDLPGGHDDGTTGGTPDLPLPGAPVGEDAGSLTAWLSSYFESSLAAGKAFRALDDGGVPI